MINRALIRLKVVQMVYAYLQNEGQEERPQRKKVLKELDLSIADAHNLYMSLLRLLTDLHAYAVNYNEALATHAARLHKEMDENAPTVYFANNKLLLQLVENEELLKFAAHHEPIYDRNSLELQKLAELCIQSEIFKEYIDAGDYSYEADHNLVRKLYKTYICENDDIDEQLENLSIYWNAEKDIVDSFVLKTLNRFDENTTSEQPLLELYGTDEDPEFARRLFEATIDHTDELNTLIEGHLKNWDFSRLAFMDLVVMRLALAEILYIEEVPLTVSLNEYLNIAKAYSTPNSAKYINGVLDAIVKNLKKEGKLLK